MVEKRKITIDWRSRFQTNIERYGGNLVLHYGLSYVDVGVFMFLLTRKWYTDQSAFSKNSISTELNSIPINFKPPKFRIQYTPGRVDASIAKLVGYGFVEQCKNQKKKKVAHRNPDFLYETVDITELQTKIEQQLEKTRKDMLSVLEYLGTTEEDVMAAKSEMEVQDEE